MYCIPSNMPVAVAAAFLPPKSIDAVPESMECTMLMANEFTTKAAMIQESPGESQMIAETDDLQRVADKRDRGAAGLEDPVGDGAGGKSAEDACAHNNERPSLKHRES